MAPRRRALSLSLGVAGVGGATRHRRPAPRWVDVTKAYQTRSYGFVPAGSIGGLGLLRRLKKPGAEVLIAVPPEECAMFGERLTVRGSRVASATMSEEPCKGELISLLKNSMMNVGALFARKGLHGSQRHSAGHFPHQVGDLHAHRP